MEASAYTSPRSRKQLTFYLAGCTFFTLSTLLTRRSIHRKHLWPTPKFFQPSNLPPPIPINSTVMAVEALQLATVNVLSFMMMMAGGLAWAFDVSGVEEARRRIPVRKGRGVGEGGGGDADTGWEEELPQWIVGMVKGEGKEGERKRDEKRRVKREGREGFEVGVVEDKFMGEEKEMEKGNKSQRPWWRPW